jgi:hypothetical protein
VLATKKDNVDGAADEDGQVKHGHYQRVSRMLVGPSACPSITDCRSASVGNDRAPAFQASGPVRCAIPSGGWSLSGSVMRCLISSLIPRGRFEAWVSAGTPVERRPADEEVLNGGAAGLPLTEAVDRGRTPWSRTVYAVQ